MAANRAFARVQAVFGLLGVIALVVTYAIITGWNPLPGWGNWLANNTASAKFVIKPHASSTGFVDDNKYFTGDGATAPAASAWSTYTTNYKFGKNNNCVTAVSVSAIVSPAVDS